MLISYTVLNEWNTWYAITMTFFWGIQDSAVNNFIWCICGFEFENESRPFAIFFFLQSLAIFLLLYVASLLKTQTEYLIYFGVCFAIGLFGWLLFALTFDLKEEKDNVEVSIMNTSSITFYSARSAQTMDQSLSIAVEAEN